MPRKRDHISTETMLAAALLALGLVPYDDAKAMGRTNFLSLWNYDHNIRHAEDGTDEFFNLTPMLIPAHRKKTAEIDAPEMARNRDVRASQAIHKAKLELKNGNHVAAGLLLATVSKKSRLKPKQKIAQRANPWPKGRKLQSRSSFAGRAP